MAINENRSDGIYRKTTSILKIAIVLMVKIRTPAPDVVTHQQYTGPSSYL